MLHILHRPEHFFIEKLEWTHRHFGRRFVHARGCSFGVTLKKTSAKIALMETDAQMTVTPQAVDVTGLPKVAIEAVQSLVALLRDSHTSLSMPRPFSSKEEWANAVREWAANHPVRKQLADDSRETIYAGRGE